MYISCYIQGGLGNQLFEICTVLSYSIDNNKIPFFNYLDIAPSCTYRCTYWNTLLNNISKYTHTNNTINFINYNEIKSFKYNKIPYYKDNINIIGHFQSYKYFNHNKDEIINILNFNEIKKNIFNKYNYLISDNTICMHFRYGDYKKYNKDYILPIQYYKNALNIILDIFPNIKNCICFYEKEDDITISNIIKEFNKHYDILFTKINNSIPDWEQLILMSLYKNIIISNSTFSWWSAYLSQEHSNVFTPNIWNGNNIDDLLLPEWIKVNIN